MHALDALLQYPDYGLLFLRIAVAATFLAHGPKKLNGSMGGFMTFIGVCETLGALAVLLGVLTQWAALGLGIIMCGAIYKKNMEWHVPFAAKDKMGWEFDLMILAACIALLTLGAGSMVVSVGI